MHERGFSPLRIRRFRGADWGKSYGNLPDIVWRVYTEHVVVKGRGHPRSRSQSGGMYMAEKTPVVGIIMGSKSDLPTMEGCTAELERLGVPYELVIASAHRTPDKVHEWAATAADRGIKVIIAAAGKAAHLGGVVAAFTPLPVIGVPMKTSDLGGLDSLLSMVQMPSGVPVACVAINGSKNAAIFATQILGATMPEYRTVIENMKREMAEA